MVFAFASALVNVSDGRAHTEQSLLQSAIEAFAGLFPEIPNENRRQPPPECRRKGVSLSNEVKALVDEMDFDALVGEFSDGCPIFEIASAAIQLVENDALGFAGAEKLKSLVETLGVLALRGCFPFLKPCGDGELITLGIAQNRVALFLKPDTPFVPCLTVETRMYPI